MNQTVPISVLVPLRWKCLGLVVIVGVILGIVGVSMLPLAIEYLRHRRR